MAEEAPINGRTQYNGRELSFESWGRTEHTPGRDGGQETIGNYLVLFHGLNLPDRVCKKDRKNVTREVDADTPKEAVMQGIASYARLHDIADDEIERIIFDAHIDVFRVETVTVFSSSFAEVEGEKDGVVEEVEA